MKLNILITASIIAVLAFSTNATSDEKNLSILAGVDSPDIRVLNSEEISAMRGQYFSSFEAAYKFCATSYPGCSGPIMRVGGPYQYRSQYVVKSALTGKYLKY